VPFIEVFCSFRRKIFKDFDASLLAHLFYLLYEFGADALENKVFVNIEAPEGAVFAEIGEANDLALFDSNESNMRLMRPAKLCCICAAGPCLNLR
jgi:hypothetical protein